MHLLAYFNPEAAESIQISWRINGLCKDVLELNCTVNLTVYHKTRVSKLFMAKVHGSRAARRK
jgi:hypothetical protein